MLGTETNHRLQLLVDFIRLRPSLFQIVAFLSSNVCPYGEISGVSTAKLRNDGWIVTDSQFGFHEHTEFEPVTISMDAPGAEALRHLKIVFANRLNLNEEFSDTACDVPKLDNETGIYFPTSPTRLFRFALVGKVEEHISLKNYYECVRSILMLWENLQILDEKSDAVTKESSTFSRELTKRQAIILDLIREGKTNSKISEEIGFSDSLVKQETILIYKKLGVSGRKDLISEKNRENRGSSHGQVREDA